jgi:hypothetical protein
MRRLLAGLLVVALLTPTVVAQSEDSAEPRIEWSSPWDRGQYEGLPDTSDEPWTASDGTLQLRATILDESSIERVTIERRYRAAVDGDQEHSQRTIRLGSTTQIDETIHAGAHGTTRLTITVRDVAGNTYVGQITVDVDDTSAPTADLSATLVEDEMVRVHGTVTDDTQVDEVRLHAISATKVVSPQQGRVDITRNTVEIDARVQAPPKGVEGAVTVDLVDRAGNTRMIMVPVNASATPTATPTATPRPTTTTEETPTSAPPANLETIAPTTTATPVNQSDPPAQTPETSNRGVGVFDVLGVLFAVVVICLGGIVAASFVTGGRY